jgi:branched-chain amino acid transport system substrate-binding protein
MRRALIAAAVVAGLAAVPTAEPARADGDTYKLGAILAMTGSAPYYGQVMSRGIQLAIDEINADGGVEGTKLELVIEDHKSGSAQEGVAAMNRLLSLHGTRAVLTSFSPPTLAIAPIADEREIFLINGGGVSANLINASKYLVHNRQLATNLAAGVIERAKEIGGKRMAVIQWRTDAGDNVRDIFREMWTEDGREIVAVEAVVQGAPNIDTQVAKVRASRPDIVALGVFKPEVGLVLKRLRELGVTVPVIGVEYTAEDGDIAGRHAVGYEYTNEYFHPTDDNPWAKQFYESYKARHDQEPDIYAANYYEGTYVIAELIRRAKAGGADYRNGAKLHEMIWENPRFKSVYGAEMLFDRGTGVAAKQVALFRINEDRQPEFVTYLGAGN